MTTDTIAPEIEEIKKGKKSRSKRKEPVLPSADLEKINNCLTTIYRDEHGEIPNMQKIAIKKPSRFGVFFKLLLAVGIIGGGVYSLQKGTPVVAPSDSVLLTMQNAGSVAINATSTYTITYENNDKVALGNVGLNIYFPEGFAFIKSDPTPGNSGHNEWKLPDLKPGEKKTITVTGKQFGANAETKLWRVFLNYQPANFNSSLQKVITSKVALSGSPAELSISGPESVAVGVEDTYRFTVTISQPLPASVQLAPMFPSSFTISSSSPALKNNKWTVPNLSAPTSTTYVLQGKFTALGESTLKGQLLSVDGTKSYTLAEATLTPKLTKNDLLVSLAINGATDNLYVKPGEVLHTTVQIKNQSGRDLTNATAVITFDMPALNKKSIVKWADITDKLDGDLKGEQLSDSARRGQLTWTSKHLPALAKIKNGETVNIDVTVPLWTTADFDFASLTGAGGTVVATLAATNAGTTQTVSTKPLSVNLNSDTALEVRSTNNGGVYTVTWVVTNHTHDLNNAKISATIFGNTRCAAGTTSAGTMSCEDKKVVWNIPALPLNMDVFTGTFTLSQGNVDPSQNTLLSKSVLEATDTVTHQSITATAPEIKLR